MIIIALFLLRFAIGYHFFSEGRTKFESKNFDAKYFLLAAKGPLAKHYHSLVDDYDGRLRLCYGEELDELENRQPTLDPELTFVFWRDFLNKADEKYQFGSADIIKKIEQERGKLAHDALEARNRPDSISESQLAKLEYERSQLSKQERAMRTQREDANDIIDRYEEQLAEFLAANREDILAYFSGEDRKSGFEQDGPNKTKVVSQVESLFGQVKTIESERQKKAAAWLKEVEQMWTGFETEINQLANEYQTRNGTISLERPFSPTQSKLKLVNKWVPWFDVIIGCLLMIGLFSRFASLLGAGFLASVIASQPPWVLDAVPTYYQFVELAGLFVIFATCAGRAAGLDYFIHQTWNRYRNADDLEDDDLEDDDLEDDDLEDDDELDS